MTYIVNGVGLGMPPNELEHQKKSLSIIRNFYKKFDGAYMIHEVSVVDNPTRVPDLSVWADGKHKDFNKDTKNLLLTIEITHTLQNDGYSTESILDVFDRVPTLNESFMYNYKRNIWTRFSRESDGIQIEEGKDYSRVLRCYMHTLLD